MKKNLFLHTLLGLALSVFLFNSCSKKSEHLKLIPAETGFVASIDLAGILKKANTKEVMEMQLFKTLQEELRTENRRLSMTLDEIQKKPSSSGVSFSQPIYVFEHSTNPKESIICISISLSNRKNFEKTLRGMLKPQDEDFKVYQADGVYFISPDEKTAIGWDNEKALVVMSVSDYFYGNITKTMASLFKNENNILQNKDFNNFSKTKKDVGVWLSMEQFFINMLDENMRQLIDLELYEGSFLSMLMNFEKDLIAIKAITTYGEKMASIYTKDMYEAKLNKSMIELFPATQYLFMSARMNTLKVVNALPNHVLAQIQEANEMMAALTGHSLEDLFKSFGDNFFLSLYGFNPIPQFAVAFELSNPEVLNDMLKIVPNAIMQGEVLYLPVGNMPLFAYMSNNFIFLSNDMALTNQASTGTKPSPNLSETKIRKSIEKHFSYLNLNLRINEYPDEITSLLRMSPQGAIVLSVMEDFTDEIELKSVNMYESDILFKLKPQNKNALFSLLSLINENYRNFTN